MPEYAGYVKKPTPIDWGAVAGGIVTKMEDVEKKHTAFREKHDKMVSDMNKQFSEYESTKAPAVDQVLFQLTTEGKSLLNDTHNRLKYKEIEPSFMGLTSQSMSDNTTKLYNITTNIGTVLAEAQAQVDEGDSNPIMQQWAIDQYKNNTNLKNNKPVWVQNQNNGYTNLVLQKIDNKGALVPGPGTTTSIETLGNINNLRFLPIDLDADMSSFKNTFEIKRDGGGVTYRPITEDATNIFINSYLSDNNKVLGLLTMYGNHVPYAEGEDPDLTEPSKSIKMVVNDDYKYEPEFTDNQLIAAKNILIERISRLGGEKEPIKQKIQPPTVGELKDKAAVQLTANALGGDEAAIQTIIATNPKVSDIEIIQEGPPDKIGIWIKDDKGTKTRTPWQKTGGKPDISKTIPLVLPEVTTTNDAGKISQMYTDYIDDTTIPSAIKTRKIIPVAGGEGIKYKVGKTPTDAIDAISSNPDKYAARYFKDLGIPGVKVKSSVATDNYFTVTIPEIGDVKIKKKIMKLTKSGAEYTDPGATQPTIKDIKNDINDIIKKYYEKLSLEQPQQEQIDIMETGAKYNVA